MTRGYEEWRDALVDINAQVLELMKQYPGLAEFVDNVNHNGEIEKLYKYRR